MHHPGSRFRHEAVFYNGADDFVHQTAPFIREGIEADEAILVVVSAAKIERLRAELGSDSERARFADMDDVGLNPARIIPAWRAFVVENAASGRGMRGIGEPIWRERDPAALVECQLHESLLNVAFGPQPAWQLLCPYDVASLDAPVLREARRSHPYLSRDGRRRRSRTYRDVEAFSAPFDVPLSAPPAHASEFPIAPGRLEEVRSFADRQAAAASLPATRRSDFVLAVNELATNSLRHGGGRGILRTWQEEDALIAEVRDTGRISNPLVGRERPSASHESGFGLWLVNQVSDLVQIRTFEDETAIRIRVARG